MKMNSKDKNLYYSYSNEANDVGLVDNLLCFPSTALQAADDTEWVPKDDGHMAKPWSCKRERPHHNG